MVSSILSANDLLGVLNGDCPCFARGRPRRFFTGIGVLLSNMRSASKDGKLLERESVLFKNKGSSSDATSFVMLICKSRGVFTLASASTTVSSLINVESLRGAPSHR